MHDNDGDEKLNKTEFVEPLKGALAQLVLEDLLAADD